MTGKNLIKTILAAAVCAAALIASCENTAVQPGDETCECTVKELAQDCDCPAAGTDTCTCRILGQEPGTECACAGGTEHKYDEDECGMGTDCACRVYYGEVIGLTNGGKNVRIYKEAGANITNDQMAAAVANLDVATSMNTSLLPDLTNIISEIHIIDNGNYYLNDNLILGIKYNMDKWDMSDIYSMIGDETILPGTTAMR